ncbi:MAG: hypothetical protein ACRDRX_25490 [Pseudonocardiaceae bacterium]
MKIVALVAVKPYDCGAYGERKEYPPGTDKHTWSLIARGKMGDFLASSEPSGLKSGCLGDVPPLPYIALPAIPEDLPRSKQ